MTRLGGRRRPPRTSSPTVCGLLLAVALASAGCDDGGEAQAADTVADAAPDTAGEADSASEIADTAVADTVAPAPSVEQIRYEADLAFVAQPRSRGSDHWQAVQDLCADRLAGLGYAVERHAYGSGVNVVGVLEGTAAASELVVVSAHYDHIPGCSGADDNGSGVAGLLEAARVLAATPHERTLVVACWDEEERGLVGSGAWAERAVTRGDEVVIMYDFEMIGFRTDAPNSQTLPGGIELLFPEQVAAVEANDFRGDFVAVIADASDASGAAAAAMEVEGPSLGLPTLVLQLPEGLETSPLVGQLRRSDHAEFWDRGIPALMITDTSEFRYSGYHCSDGDDSPDRLDAAFATAIVEATVASARTLLMATK